MSYFWHFMAKVSCILNLSNIFKTAISICWFIRILSIFLKASIPNVLSKQPPGAHSLVSNLRFFTCNLVPFTLDAHVCQLYTSPFIDAQRTFRPLYNLYHEIYIPEVRVIDLREVIYGFIFLY